MTASQPLDFDHGVTMVDVSDAGDVTWPRPVPELAGRLARSLGTAARIWHVSSTATGGGVAELLWSSIAHQRSLGLPVNWLIADAVPEYFQLTKRIHHGLHGRATEPFDPAAARLYRSVTARSAGQLLDYVRPGDIVLLHDPQTIGAAPHLVGSGARVAWRCHIGTRKHGPVVDATWEFLRPYVTAAAICVFTMSDFAPVYLSAERLTVITPSIDPGSAKNRELSVRRCRELLAGIGLMTGEKGNGPVVGRTVQDQPLPPDAPVVTQVSRWDPLKDMTGVLRTFAERVAHPAHLLLLGPDPADIPDDPEGAGVFSEVLRMRERLPIEIRARVHLATLTLRDMDANALVVNAAQRHSTVVVQKSLEEGFGLTVTEAMWKARPIVASAVGGITVQLTDGVDGLLVDPLDYTGFGDRVDELLARPDLAARLGAAARRTCEDRFLAVREISDYLRLYASIVR